MTGQIAQDRRGSAITSLPPGLFDGLAQERDEQIAWLYRLTLGRKPSAAETRRLADFAARQGMENASRAILNSNEFLFVD